MRSAVNPYVLSAEDSDERDAVVESHVSDADIVTAEAAAAIFSEFEERAAQGDHQAERIIASVSVEGFMGHVKRVVKKTRAMVEVMGGSIVAAPVAYGIRARTAEGVLENYSQQTMILTCSREVFNAIRDSLTAKYDALGGKVGAFARWSAIWDMHPGAATLQEACDLEGVDPMNLPMQATL